MTNSKQEYNFDTFLKKFFPSEYHEREKASDPYEVGVSISKSALTKMDNLLKSSKKPSLKERTVKEKAPR